MNKSKTEDNTQNQEKVKSTKKSTYSKKKKTKKKIVNGIAYVQSTFNNTIVSIADTEGNVISWASAGQKGFKGSRKSTPYAAGIIFFTFFYTSITFNPNETAENLRKYGGFIPGIRPGESTAIYIDTILTKLTTIGALYLTLVCLMPEFLIANYPIPFYLGGTSILIVVVVAIDTVTQIQTRLMSSQYEQLVKKTKFGR